MVTMRKGELKLYMCSVIDSLEGEAYDRFCELFLTACGVVDEEGNLTQEYASSPYWAGGTGGRAVASCHGERERERFGSQGERSGRAEPCLGRVRDAGASMTRAYRARGESRESRPPTGSDRRAPGSARARRCAPATSACAESARTRSRQST